MNVLLSLTERGSLLLAVVPITIVFMARHPDDWKKMSKDELLFMLHSAEAGSEDFEHARAELEYRKRQPDEDIQPDIEWAERESARKGIPLRCPFASVELCPRFYLSTAMLGVSGVTTKIAEADDKRLQAKWEKHPCWPATMEQEPGVLSRDGDPRSFHHFCPEVMYDTVAGADEN